MELQTKRLKLIACNPDFVSTISSEEYEIGEHIEEHLNELKKDPTILGWGVWFVVNKQNNRIIGDIGFKGKPSLENTVEIGYGLVPSAQKNGYATEAVKAVIEWAFTSNQVNKVIAECLEDNIPSIRVLERLKMNRVEQKGNMLKWELKNI
ncbi:MULTISPECIES: GNAT family N-acetyltransferase [Bacillus]|uniref:GNAT family N-acetyltransferase n=1 Tax=Bacillus TaxID=1386 RepID=UPI000BFD9F3B|nr:GNAT family N-acetyltransferase [Bacillus pseudomycoides]MDF2086155.1 GNAT family N-acetyltransferase [Bacillus pseudomycoides]PGT50358.1 GNAT family N-acetyltransferase [Bacillus cereus]PGV88941.1 GNAT family N-acetyltransferase [Bacillus cereus]